MIKHSVNVNKLFTCQTYSVVSAQLCYTVQHETVLITFLLILQIIITKQTVLGKLHINSNLLQLQVT